MLVKPFRSCFIHGPDWGLRPDTACTDSPPDIMLATDAPLRCNSHLQSPLRGSVVPIQQALKAMAADAPSGPAQVTALTDGHGVEFIARFPVDEFTRVAAYRPLKGGRNTRQPTPRCSKEPHPFAAKRNHACIPDNG
jgi:hypothetical protein